MSVIAPFKGLRFKLDSASDLSRVICPPYDVISANQHKELLSRHPLNVVRLELPHEDAAMDKYKRASFSFTHWRQEGILDRDKVPALYLYSQEYRLEDGRPLLRKGFFAAVKIEEPRKGSILPHERTLPKPKEERLNLMKALRLDVSPIFGLFSDPKRQAQKIIAHEMQKKPEIDIPDENFVRHRLWILNDPKKIQALIKIIKPKKIFIADGHHRYETSWAYRQLVRDALMARTPEAAHYVLTFLCPMEDPGLVVLPTHRVVNGPVAWEAVRASFETKSMTSAKNLEAAMKRAAARHAFGLVTRDGMWLLVLKNNKILKEKLASSPPAIRSLDVAILHQLLLSDVNVENINFVKDFNQACDVAKSNPGSTAYLLNGTRVDQVKAVSLAGEVMPQKSTYFTPKLATGLVLMTLEDNL